MATIESLVHRWFEEVWNKGSEDAIDEMLAPGAMVHGLVDSQGKELCGPEQFKEFFRNFRNAFPDIRVSVEDVLVQGDKAAMRCLVTGVHTGEGIGIPPTQKPIQFGGICIAVVKDGKFVEGWNHFDFLELYRQLDAFPF